MPRLRLLPGLLLAAGVVCSHAAAARSLESLAADIAARDADFSTLWPGYWPPGQPFVLYQGTRCVMRSAQPPTGFTRVDDAPDLWLGRCDDARFKGPILLGDRIGGIAAPAVQITSRRESVDDSTVFLLHEAFHAFQVDAFRQPERVRTDYAFALDPELVRMKLREANLLASAAGNDDKLASVTLVRAAIATRKARLARMPPEVQALEDAYLLREGSAEYVGLRAGLAVGGGGSSLDEVRAALRAGSRAPGRTWEYLLRWQSYASGAAAGLFLDRWGVDWKPHIAAGRSFHDILEVATGYDHAVHASLADASEDAGRRETFAVAKELIANDRAAVKAFARFEEAADFMLEVGDDTGESNATFSTAALFTVSGGVVVMAPQPFNSTSKNADIQVNGRPIRLHERDEEDAASRPRLEIALTRAPEVEGCAPDAAVCAAGTRMRTRGARLELKQAHRIERTPTRWRLWPADDAG